MFYCMKPFIFIWPLLDVGLEVKDSLWVYPVSAYRLGRESAWGLSRYPSTQNQNEENVHKKNEDRQKAVPNSIPGFQSPTKFRLWKTKKVDAPLVARWPAFDSSELMCSTLVSLVVTSVSVLLCRNRVTDSIQMPSLMRSLVTTSNNLWNSKV